MGPIREGWSVICESTKGVTQSDKARDKRGGGRNEKGRRSKEEGMGFILPGSSKLLDGW